MQNTIPGLRKILTYHRLMCAMAALGLLFGLAQSARTQTSTNPLNLFKNYFVTGDYVVGGVGLRGLGINGFATGTISIPDGVQSHATGVASSSVPPGAEIVAAFLYWETVESSKAQFAGQNGFFNGYPISGKVLGNPNAPVSWSSGGCTGSSNGSKTMRTYRADVRPFLPLDAQGKVQANGQYQVKLADSGSNGGGTPLTLGATLVIIYRVLSPAVPLNSIILYDGAFSPSNAAKTTSESITGFYQASQNPVAKLTQIVGNGQPNKYETVNFNGVKLPSPYKSLPPFPGVYNRSWDNPTWLPNNFGAAVNFNDSTETTSVVPQDKDDNDGKGCVSWGATIFSTTVQDTDGDGLLDVWETNQGFTDVNSGEWVALPGANPTVPDIFVQVDYLDALNHSSIPLTGHSHLPKQAALDAVGAAYNKHNIHVHFDVGPVYQGDPYVISYPLPVPLGTTAPPVGTGGHGITESSIECTDSAGAFCEYPGQAVISWKTGFENIKSQNFWHGRKDSYHYLLAGHAIGMPATTWTATGIALPNSGAGTLTSIVDSGNIATVTIQTPVQNPPVPIPTNTDRVTVAGAIGKFSLNGTYFPINLVSQTVTGAVSTTIFTITTLGVANGTYNFSNEPQLAIVFGGPKSTSGFSDYGGADSLITLGLWTADDAPTCQKDPSQPLTAGQAYCDDQVGSLTVQTGTLMHELGHPLALTHGGTYYPAGTANLGSQINNPIGLPSFGLNCKPNFLSVMNYLFQIRGFSDGAAIDYSGQTLPNLSESSLNEQTGIGLDLFTNLGASHFTRWYAPPNAIDIKLQNTVGGRFATTHCDGSPITDGAQMVKVDGSTFSAPSDWNNDGAIQAGTFGPQDVSFNGVIGDPPFQGFNDWLNMNLAQIGARRNVGGFSGDVGGADIFGGGADIFGGGADIFGGGADIFGGGADIFGGGADVFGGGAELDFTLANSTVDSPAGLNCTNCVLVSGILTEGTLSVPLAWTPPGFGQIRQYTVWRATGSFPTLASVLANINSFSSIGTINGTPPVATFIDHSVVNNKTYTYFVTDANAQSVQSGPSAPVTVKVTLPCRDDDHDGDCNNGDDGLDL